MNHLLETQGFTADPFGSTNADDEPLLASYFVPPPYFAAVQGDPDNPKPSIVLAPRGGGKTAQKRMIERESIDGRFLCIAYDRFDVPAGLKIEDVTWEYHVTQICRLMTVGVLAALEESDEAVEKLSDSEKRLVKFYAERFLGDLSADDFETALGSVKTFGDKAGDLWEKWGGPIAGIVNIILTRLKLQAIQLDDSFRTEMTRDESLRYHLGRLSAIVRTLGFRSTYVLVDRVDEIELTATDASMSFEFVKPLLADLPTVEQDGIGFKFFLWDAMKDDLRAAGIRADRVPMHELLWSPDDLRTMMGQRLSALSDGSVTQLQGLMCDGAEIDLDLLASHMAEGSPRDMIRLMARVVAEETRVSQEKQCIGMDGVWDGVRGFSEVRAEELFPGDVQEIRRVGATGTVTFTVNRLASDIYRVTAQSARARVQNWTRTAMVEQIGEVPNPPNRPMYLYGPVDLRLVVAMLPNSPPDEVLGNFCLECPGCGRIAISDQLEITCQACSHRFALGDAKSLIEVCAL